MKDIIQIIRVVGQSIIVEVNKLQSVFIKSNKELVEEIKKIPPNNNQQNIKVDMSDTNKLLSDLTAEVKKKEDTEIEVEISPEQYEELKGKDGHTPIKGEDYFTDKEAKEFLKKATPIKGVHYKDGEPCSPDTAEQVRDKLQSLSGEERLDAKAIKNLPEPKIIMKGGGATWKKIGDHSQLAKLDYENSGHTGFQRKLVYDKDLGALLN